MCAGLEWGCSGGRLLPGYIVWTNPHLDVQRSCPQVLVENLKGGLSKQLDSGLFHLSSFNALLSGGTREWWYEGGVGEGELLSMCASCPPAATNSNIITYELCCPSCRYSEGTSFHTALPCHRGKDPNGVRRGGSRAVQGHLGCAGHHCQSRRPPWPVQGTCAHRDDDGAVLRSGREGGGVAAVPSR